MSQEGFARLEDVVLDPLFAEVDLDLRQGRHVNRHESERYGFLRDAFEHLEGFYLQYDCELRHATEGFFHLVPNGSGLGRRRLTAGEMLVGQALAIAYLDPETVRKGGSISSEEIVRRLAGIVGEERLVEALNPRRRRLDERVAEENVREEVDKALRGLASLGFVESGEGGQMRVCPSLLRFAEPVHGLEDRAAALERLIAQGRVAPPIDDGNPDTEEEA